MAWMGVSGAAAYDTFHMFNGIQGSMIGRINAAGMSAFGTGTMYQLTAPKVPIYEPFAPTIQKSINTSNATYEPRLSNNIIGNSYDISKLIRTQPYTYPETVSAIKGLINSGGPNVVPPIPIRVNHGQVLIVNGHHRLEAFRQLGYTRVPIKYVHSSQLGKIQPNGEYYRSLSELLAGIIGN